MAEFEYRFLWKEFPHVVRLLDLGDMAIVCHHALAPGRVVQFSMDHVVRFAGPSHVYFAEDLPRVATVAVEGTSGFPHDFHVVDDLRLPEHFNLMGFAPADEKILPRLGFSLARDFNQVDSYEAVAASDRIGQRFKGIRERLAATGFRATHRQSTVIASHASVAAIRAGRATSADLALDEALLQCLVREGSP
jgi:hypothetical protein